MLFGLKRCQAAKPEPRAELLSFSSCSGSSTERRTQRHLSVTYCKPHPTRLYFSHATISIILYHPEYVLNSYDTEGNGEMTLSELASAMGEVVGLTKEDVMPMFSQLGKLEDVSFVLRKSSRT